jgi:hypothetical protein
LRTMRSSGSSNSSMPRRSATDRSPLTPMRRWRRRKPTRSRSRLTSGYWATTACSVGQHQSGGRRTPHGWEVRRADGDRSAVSCGLHRWRSRQPPIPMRLIGTGHAPRLRLGRVATHDVKIVHQ